jgi:dolichol-phosphate mannosyltransferase
MEISSGDAVVLMDGDGQDPPEEIPRFIEQWEQGFDIVYGQRVKREAPWHMQLFYKLFYRLFRKLSDITMPVDAGDFSLIDRKAVSKILKFTEKDVFLRGLRAWVGYKQTGVPYVRPERLFGKTTNNFAKNIWWAKKGILSFSMKPLYYIQNLGIFIFIATICLSAFYLINYLVDPPKNAQGITTIILLVLGLGSIQIISMSVLGDYIGKITEEVKNRPRFIRQRILYNGLKYEDDEEITKIVDQIKQNR